ncbi:hypothetical protein NLG97_g3499 [Lecanicillium saksenae]|uniref:Uncharacterized protein n=1 Tax=Lecanicillium saksenae TaxID=468837 RepID=A0ACC1R157_9HYPO|nr:hypothetical protein NLG97_g3499 [Lecanicillium saksenae]
MYNHLIIALGIFVTVGSCGGALDDFSNNLATDLGPLLVLFGEPMTKQYLSECTSFIDYFIFAMAPIGVLTAMASVIRVCGHPSIRAFIGRSQEGQATVEAELCTSTSRDVCELFNRDGITRVLGRPSILELVHFTRGGEQSQVDDKTADTHLLRQYLQDLGGSVGSEWDKISGKSTDFAKYPPNLSLNVGIVRRPDWVFRAVALLGFVLQTGLVVLAAVGAWKLGWAVNQTGSPSSRNYAPIMYIIGTALMSTGMWGCAAVIGQTTDEVQYKRKQSQSDEAKGRAQLFWLQPGPQFIGDQCFNSFAYTEDEPLPIWTSSTKLSGDRFKYLSISAVGAALVGYIMQFIGLRGMKAWLSISQLGVTVFMSMARGALRAQRLTSAANRLTDSPDAPEAVSGHELDWMAFEIVKCSVKRDPTVAKGSASSEKLVWYVTSRHEQADDTDSSAHGAQHESTMVAMTPAENTPEQKMGGDPSLTGVDTISPRATI